MSSWKPEVIADNSGKWCGNALRFATREEALDNAFDLSMRWMAVREFRVVESDDPVNSSYANHQLRTVDREDREAQQSLADLEQSRDAR
jgi:hypothetical protein